MRRRAGALAAALLCCRSSSWCPPVATFGRRWPGPCEVPKGLLYQPRFVTPSEQQELLQVLDGPGACWMRKIRRAQQFFGLVYYQTSQVVQELQPTEMRQGRPLEQLPEWLLERIRATELIQPGAAFPLGER